MNLQSVAVVWEVNPNKLPYSESCFECDPFDIDGEHVQNSAREVRFVSVHFLPRGRPRLHGIEYLFNEILPDGSKGPEQKATADEWSAWSNGELMLVQTVAPK